MLSRRKVIEERDFEPARRFHPYVAELICSQQNDHRH